MYKLIKDAVTNTICSVNNLDNNTSIPFAPENTDYQNFKTNILADKATLQDADGNEMTAEQAKEFVSTLP